MVQQLVVRSSTLHVHAEWLCWHLRQRRSRLASYIRGGPLRKRAVPDPYTVPEDSLAGLRGDGRDLIAHTSALIGPDAADPAMRFAGNGLDCQNCHLAAGTKQFGIPLAAACYLPRLQWLPYELDYRPTLAAASTMTS